MMNILGKKMGTGFDSHFFKAVIQMASKHLENTVSGVIREICVQVAVRSHLQPFVWLEKKRSYQGLKR